MKPEKRLYEYRVKPVLQSIADLEFDRIETGKVTVGVPDIIYTRGGTGFIELKIGDTLKGWSSRQRRWARRHVECGARVWLILATTGGDKIVSVHQNPQMVEATVPFGCFTWNIENARELL